MNVTEATLNYFGTTDVGLVRNHNEDSFVIIDLSAEEPNPMGILLMVADGMGGANAGEVASAIACKVIEERILKLQQAPLSQKDVEKYLKNLLLEAHFQILEHTSTHTECEGMGTTAIIAWIVGGHIHLSWCGDSRCYLYQKTQRDPLSPYTDDHSLVWQMVQNGELSAEEARLHEQSNIILQVLGSMDTRPSPSYTSKKLEEGEKILLCSDGLNGMLSDVDIQQILEQHEDVHEATSSLVERANRMGGTDNITVILAEVTSIESTDKPQKVKAPNRKIRWAFLLLFTLLFIILVWVVFVWNGNKSADAEQEDRAKQVAYPTQIIIPENGDEANEIAETEKKSSSPPEVAFSKNPASPPAEDLPTHAYDFQGELKLLNDKLEKQIANTKKLIEDCATCHENPELEQVNESLTDAHNFIKNQLAEANDSLAIKPQSREKLAAISHSLHIPYDAENPFHPDSISEQEYMINTLNTVVKNISAQLKVLTTDVQDKN